MISIVTSYYNRKKLFLETLKTIEKSRVKDIEFIVVDDGSDQKERLEPLQSRYPFLKVIRLEKENKWYINPCVPFNIGIKEAKGDKLVLQNPECLHVHDVLATVEDELTDDNYISMSCYAVSPQQNQQVPFHNEQGTLAEYMKTFPQRVYIGGDNPGWYNHSKIRPTHFHFCAAISRNNMAKLNGFDETFAGGIGYDDDEIVARIRMLGINMIIKDDVSVIHQYHPTLWAHPNGAYLCEINRRHLHNTRVLNNPYAQNSGPLWNGN
jgi:glycosyltransferase involved in cell wall biosynthesis